jgi:hypothetical protein
MWISALPSAPPADRPVGARRKEEVLHVVHLCVPVRPRSGKDGWPSLRAMQLAVHMRVPPKAHETKRAVTCSSSS